jgi:hypothetical protein
MIHQALCTTADRLGYIVTTNKSLHPVFGNSNASKYWNSRPDLVIYKNDHAYVVITVEPASDETTTDETTTTTILRGGVTENITDIPGTVLGQLLTGMDKVAGDLAYQQLRNGELPPERRVFQQIKIYGLIIDLEGSKSKPYVLNMDFNMKSSELFCGRQELDLATSMNRLLSCLECK